MSALLDGTMPAKSRRDAPTPIAYSPTDSAGEPNFLCGDPAGRPAEPNMKILNRPDPAETPLAQARTTSPCLGSVALSPCGARGDFSDCHYITVFSFSGGAGGLSSVNPNAFKTRRASGQPPLTPCRSG